MGKIEVIGVMSGTSLDGLDLCHVVFNLENLSDFKIANSTTIIYPKMISEKLYNIVDKNITEINKIDIDYGTFIGESINNFISDLNLNDINLISSHGHTVFHQPDIGKTLQIGNGKIINKITGIKTVNNFRAQDLSLNGQGAPLVPIGDKILFSNFKYCLNLGGFINLSLKSGNDIIAYDICPFNTVLNFYSRKIGYEYDEDGLISSRGKINSSLFNELNSISFYSKTNPKSLGIEFVINQIFPLINNYKIDSDWNDSSVFNYQFTHRFYDNARVTSKYFDNLLNPILKKYMADNNIKLVIDKKNVLLGDSSLEITSQIIDILNKELKSLKLN